MAKNSLQAVLDRQKVEVPAPIVVHPAAPAPASQSIVAAKAPAAQQPVRPSRTGTKFVGGHFTPLVAKQIKLLAAEEGMTTQALLEEALDLLFVKKGKGRIVKAEA